MRVRGEVVVVSKGVVARSSIGGLERKVSTVLFLFLLMIHRLSRYRLQ